MPKDPDPIEVWPSPVPNPFLTARYLEEAYAAVLQEGGAAADEVLVLPAGAALGEPHDRTVARLRGGFPRTGMPPWYVITNANDTGWERAKIVFYLRDIPQICAALRAG